MNSVFAIYRIWIDPMERTNAWGYEMIGFVQSKEEAERIALLDPIATKDYPWPLGYLSDEYIPRFKFKIINDLSSLTSSELQQVKK